MRDVMSDDIGPFVLSSSSILTLPTLTHLTPFPNQPCFLSLVSYTLSSHIPSLLLLGFMSGIMGGSAMKKALNNADFGGVTEEELTPLNDYLEGETDRFHIPSLHHLIPSRAPSYIHLLIHPRTHPFTYPLIHKLFPTSRTSMIPLLLTALSLYHRSHCYHIDLFITSLISLLPH